jgi:phage repressor protein C with HTH and peptisase S24 domain
MCELAPKRFPDYALRMAGTTTLERNIARLRAHLGENQAAFATRFKGAHQSYVSKWEKQGIEPSARHLGAMAHLAGVSVEQFIDEEWEPNTSLDPAVMPVSTLDDLAAEHGLTFLEEIDLPLGMGATYLSGHAEVLGVVPFKEDWLRGLYEGPLERLKVTRGKGDSMQPTIMDGDIVIVDTAHRRIDDQDRIWAVAYGELGMIRRVRVTPRGSWLLMPDNSIVRPDEVGDGEVAVIGRVIWIGRRI